MCMFPAMQLQLCQTVVTSSTAFLSQCCSFHLLSTILCADHVNVLGSEESQISPSYSQKKPLGKKKQQLTQRQVIYSLSLEVKGGPFAESAWKSLQKELATSGEGGYYSSQRPFPYSGWEKRLKFFLGHQGSQNNSPECFSCIQHRFKRCCCKGRMPQCSFFPLQSLL